MEEKEKLICINKIDAVYRGGFADALNEDFGDKAVGINAVPRPLDGSDPCQVDSQLNQKLTSGAWLRYTIGARHFSLF